MHILYHIQLMVSTTPYHRQVNVKQSESESLFGKVMEFGLVAKVPQIHIYCNFSNTAIEGPIKLNLCHVVPPPIQVT